MQDIPEALRPFFEPSPEAVAEAERLAALEKDGWVDIGGQFVRFEDAREFPAASMPHLPR